MRYTFVFFFCVSQFDCSDDDDLALNWVHSDLECVHVWRIFTYDFRNKIRSQVWVMLELFFCARKHIMMVFNFYELNWILFLDKSHIKDKFFSSSHLIPFGVCHCVKLFGLPFRVKVESKREYRMHLILLLCGSVPSWSFLASFTAKLHTWETAHGHRTHTETRANAKVSKSHNCQRIYIRIRICVKVCVGWRQLGSFFLLFPSFIFNWIEFHVHYLLIDFHAVDRVCQEVFRIDAVIVWHQWILQSRSSAYWKWFQVFVVFFFQIQRVRFFSLSMLCVAHFVSLRPIYKLSCNNSDDNSDAKEMLRCLFFLRFHL